MADDRVLVRSQTDGVENGIYLADTSSWQRAVDFNGRRDAVKGTLVVVTDGTSLGQTTWELTTTDPIIGTSSLTFSLFGAGSSLTTSTSYVGTIAALRALTTFPVAVDVLGYYAAVDHEPRKYYWHAGDVTADNLGSVIRPTVGGGCYKMATDRLSVKDFGATGDNATNDSVALLAAGVAAAGKSLYVPSGTYLCDAFKIYSDTTVTCGGGVVFKPWTATIVTTNITTTNTSVTATVASAAGLAIGQYVGAVGVPDFTTISNLVGTTVTLSAAATANGTVAGTFGNLGALSVVDLDGDGIRWKGGKILGNISTAYKTQVAPYYCMRAFDNAHTTGRPTNLVIEDLEVVGGMHGIYLYGIEGLTMRDIVSTDQYNQGVGFVATSGNGGPMARKIVIDGFRAERCGMGEGLKFAALYQALGATTTISTTNASVTATVASATGILPNQQIMSVNVPVGTYVVSIVGTTVTMSAAATATAAGTTVYFGWWPHSDIILNDITIKDCGRSMTSSSDWQEGLDIFLGSADRVSITNFHIIGCGNGGIEMKRGLPSNYIYPDKMQNINIGHGVISCDYDSTVGIALNRADLDTSNDTAGRVSVTDVEFICTVSAGTSVTGISSDAYTDVDFDDNRFYGDFSQNIYVSVQPSRTPDQTARRFTAKGCKSFGARSFFVLGNDNYGAINLIGNEAVTTDDTIVISSAVDLITGFLIQGGIYETTDAAGYTFSANGLGTGIEICGGAVLKSANFVLNLAAGIGKVHDCTLISTAHNACRVADDFTLGSTWEVFDNALVLPTTKQLYRRRAGHDLCVGQLPRQRYGGANPGRHCGRDRDASHSSFRGQ